MDSQTLELIRILQAGPYDNAAFQRIRQLLPDARNWLAASGDRETLADVTELLQEWARNAVDPAAASLALYESGELADQMLGDPERAARMFAQSVAANPRNLKAMQRAESALVHLGQFVQLEAMLSEQALALAALPEAEPEVRAAVFRALGSVQAEQTGNVDGAIGAFEQVLDAEPDVTVIAALAQLYTGRNRDDDARRAADLYCALGEVSDGAESVAYLEHALNLAPDHEQALDELEALVPEAERPARLGGRWTAFIAAAPDGPGTDARRKALAQAFMEEERYAEALQWISPAAARGDAAAMSIREGLYHLMGVDPASMQAPEAVRPAQDEWRSASGPPHNFDEQTTRDYGAVAQAARAEAAQPASVPPQAPMPVSASAPRQAQGAQPRFTPPATTMPGVGSQAADDTKTPPVQSGATLVGYAVSPELKELYGEAMEMKPPAPEPAPATGEPQAPAPFPATEAPTLVLPARQQPPVRTAPEAMGAQAVQPQVAAAAAGVTPAAAAPAAAPAAMDAALLPDDIDIKPKSALPKLLIGAGLLALVAGGVFVYMQYFAKPAKQAATAVETASGEAQPGAAETGAAAPGSEQPGAAAEPTTAGAEEAATDEAKETEAAKAESAEEAATDQKAEAAETETGGAEEKQGSVRMVSQLLRVRGGKIDQGELMEAAEEAFPEMERCYAKARRQRPRLKGRVVLSWTIKTNGRVSAARRAGGTIKSRTFASCLASAIKKTGFPKPRRKAARVSLPFVFQ